MIVVMKSGATRAQIVNVTARIEAAGCQAHISEGEERTIIGIVGNGRPLDREQIARLDGVERAVPVLQPFKLASRDFHPQDTVVPINGVSVGEKKLAIMAGPCAVEGEEELMEAAMAVKAAGATMLRGGAFKPRTSPYSFQGMGEKGLRILAQARKVTGLPVVTEVMDDDTFDLVEEYADIIQIGTRNMQNFSLLRRAGKARKPVMLKRGMAATIDEWLMAAEYILEGGNSAVILCERGVRTFVNHSRNTLDISAVPVVRKESHLPIIIDPSHAGGRRDQVIPLSRAGVAVGAHGLMVEVHHAPEKAMSDGAQSLYPHQFETLCRQVRSIFETFQEQ